MVDRELSALFPFGVDPEIYKSTSYLVLDFETTNLEKGDSRNKDNHIVLSHWKIFKDGKLVKTATSTKKEWELEELVEDVYSVDFCIAHNSKFEYGWLRRMGVDIGRVLFFCTMIGEYVLAGNRNLSLKLDDIAARRGLGHKDKLVSNMIAGGVCPSTIPSYLLKKYCKLDVDLTHKVFKQQLRELEANEQLPVMFTRCIATPVLVDIESKGMHLDRGKVLEEYEIYERQYSDISRKISEFTGNTNLNSPKQVAELVYDRLGFSELTDRRGNPIRTTANGRRTNEETISSLKTSNKSQRRFVELFKERAKVNAALNKNLLFFKGVVEGENDSIFYANLNQTVTKTHRLSSTGKKVYSALFGDRSKGIQFQNIPRLFKSLFSARKNGWKINERDASQLEFRVAVECGNDERGMLDIVGGVDVHAFTSTVLTDAGEPTDRQDAKSRTFKPLYGGTSGTKAEQKYFKEFREKYHGITDTQESWKSTVEKTKKLRIASGLIFYWPDTRWEGSSKNPYLRNTTSICNFPIQSFATADIIPIAVTIMWYLIREEKLESFIVNTIHDSLISEVHPEEIDQYDELGEWSFNQGVKQYLDKVYKFKFKTPLDSESKTGDYWNG